MSLFADLDNDIKDTMRARDMEKLAVLRTLKSGFKAAAMEKGVEDAALDDATALSVVRKELKKRQDAIESFTAGNRPDLVAKEQAEANVLSKYVPQALGKEELEKIVQAAIAEVGATSKAQMGAVMKAASAKAEGRADGKTLSAVVASFLK